MVSISPNLYKQLRNTLTNCGEFSSIDVLRAIFVDARISHWRDDLPTGRNPAELANLTIDFLLQKSNTQEENALVLFLHVLKDQKSPEDICYQKLAMMAEKLEGNIKSNLAKPHHAQSHSPSPQDLLTCFEQKFRAQDLRKVYFLMGIGYDDLVGGAAGKDEKAMALIEYCQKRACLAKLFAKMQKVFPNLTY